MPEAERDGGTAARLWGGSQPRPSGWEAYGRGTAAGRAAPHPSAGGPRRYAAAMTRAARAPGRAVLHASGILSPGKLTPKGAPCGRVLRTALRAALDRELPRQDRGAYPEDGR